MLKNFSIRAKIGNLSDILILCGGLLFALGMPWGHVSGYVGIAIGLIGIGLKPSLLKIEKDYLHIVFLILVFAIWGVILSLTIATNIKEALATVGKYCVHWLLPFIIGLTTVQKWHSKLISLWVLSLISVGTLSFLAYIGFINIDQLSSEGLLKGWHTHIQFGMLLLIALQIVIGGFLTPSLSRGHTFSLFLIGIYLGFLIALTGSRGVWFAASISVFIALIIAILLRRRILLASSFIIFGLLISAMTIAIFPQVRTRIARTGENDPSYYYRKNMTAMAQYIIAEHPLTGIGPGQTRYAKELFVRMDRLEMPVETGYLKKTHLQNIYLQITAEFGFPGLAIFTMIIVAIITALLKKSRELDGFQKGITIGVLCAFVALIFADIFDCLFRGPPVAMEMFWLIGLAFGWKNTGIKFSDSDRVLLIRTDRLGDAILTTPMASALKKHFPGMHVDLMVREYPAKILPLGKNIDNVLVYKGCITEDIKRIKNGGYHCGILVHPDPKAALVLFLSGVPFRIGTAYRLWSPLLLNTIIKTRRKGVRKHEINLNLELLKPFGIPSDIDIVPEFHITNEIAEKANKILESEGYSGRPLIIFHPGTGGSAHRCPPETMGKAASILDSRGFEVAVTGSISDSPIVERFIAEAGFRCINLIGKTDLPLLAGVFSISKIVVASGTGPLHLASALGTSVVSIFPPSVSNGPIRWAPKGSLSKVITPDVPQCKRCKGKKCPYYICTEKIQPEEIVEATMELCDAMHI